MYFRNYGHQKTWLNKCLKSPVSEGRLKSMIIVIIIIINRDMESLKIVC